MSETFGMIRHAGSLVFFPRDLQRKPDALEAPMRTTPFLPPRPNPRRSRPRAIAVALPGRDVALLVRWAGIMLVALGLLFATLDAAHAKRVGGGKSFGSRDTYSQPYNKPVSPDRSGTPTQ